MASMFAATASSSVRSDRSLHLVAPTTLGTGPTSSTAICQGCRDAGYSESSPQMHEPRTARASRTSPLSFVADYPLRDRLESLHGRLSAFWRRNTPASTASPGPLCVPASAGDLVLSSEPPSRSSAGNPPHQAKIEQPNPTPLDLVTATMQPFESFRAAVEKVQGSLIRCEALEEPQAATEDFRGRFHTSFIDEPNEDAVREWQALKATFSQWGTTVGMGVVLLNKSYCGELNRLGKEAASLFTEALSLRDECEKRFSDPAYGPSEVELIDYPPSARSDGVPSQEQADPFGQDLALAIQQDVYVRSVAQHYTSADPLSSAPIEASEGSAASHGCDIDPDQWTRMQKAVIQEDAKLYRKASKGKQPVRA